MTKFVVAFFFFDFILFIPGSNQERSDESLLGRVERDAGRRRKGADMKKTGRKRNRKTRGKKRGKQTGERKRGKKTRGKKERKAQRKCGRQSGLKNIFIVCISVNDLQVRMTRLVWQISERLWTTRATRWATSRGRRRGSRASTP